jgi:uncharacterized protein YutE (UPF0331/DUF86 family)
MDRDIIINKAQVIERCIKRINEEYENNPDNLQNYTKQDSIILNIQRASEASIDLAMHVVSEMNLGIPQSSREVFDFLYKNKIIDEDLSKQLKAMVGFRNIAVHDYQTLNLDIVKKIIEEHLEDLKVFAGKIIHLKG